MHQTINLRKMRIHWFLGVSSFDCTKVPTLFATNMVMDYEKFNAGDYWHSNN